METFLRFTGGVKRNPDIDRWLDARLEDPSGLLIGTGKRMRHVKLKAESEINETALEALLAQSYRIANSLPGGGNGSAD